MPAQPVFTDADLKELQRAKKWLARLPRVRMLHPPGRALAHGLVLGLEAVLASKVRRIGVSIETRSIVALGKRLTIRILRPPGVLAGVHFDIHGGGWCTGNAQMDDRPNAVLALACGVAVVSVDYGRAPKYPVREIISQCEAVAVWLAENAKREFGSSRITIGGESAGAHLAVCTLRRRPQIFRATLLYYGVYDLSGSDSVRNAPRNALIFHTPTMLPSLHKLTPGMTDEERRAPDISPAFADLSGLPPALFVIGTDDPLHRESLDLNARWRAANGNSELLVVPGAPHAFNRLPIAAARKAEAYAHAWLKNYFSAQSQ